MADESRSQRMAEVIARASGGGALAVIQYGSHARAGDARAGSAHDFFLIVEDYLGAYAALRQNVGTSYDPRVAALLNRFLPPNVVAIQSPDFGDPGASAKVAVLSLPHLRRAGSGRPRDHFTAGRLFQHVKLMWARDAAARGAVLDILKQIRRRTVEWGGPYLPHEFDAAQYVEALLRRSYRAEVRPETDERVATVLAGQREELVREYETVLADLAHIGKVVARGAGRYALAHRAAGRWRIDWYFRKSKVRATARWAKYVALYDGWPDYIAEKLSRRGGMRVTLTERERRHPLLFLWPKAFRYFTSRLTRKRA
jgi:hypothetical protein